VIWCKENGLEYALTGLEHIRQKRPFDATRLRIQSEFAIMLNTTAGIKHNLRLGDQQDAFEYFGFFMQAMTSVNNVLPKNVQLATLSMQMKFSFMSDEHDVRYRDSILVTDPDVITNPLNLLNLQIKDIVYIINDKGIKESKDAISSVYIVVNAPKVIVAGFQFTSGNNVVMAHKDMFTFSDIRGPFQTNEGPYSLVAAAFRSGATNSCGHYVAQTYYRNKSTGGIDINFVNDYTVSRNKEPVDEWRVPLSTLGNEGANMLVFVKVEE
jgi:hypothetical protein